MRIAIISDTHGLLRPEVESFLQGCDLICHAGDVGKEEVLTRLRAFAPVLVVKGNVDAGPWTRQLPSDISHSFPEQAFRLFMTHKWQDVPEEWRDTGSSLIIIGHSHQPELSIQGNGALKLNPGSCGPRRFKLPVSAALMLLDNDQAQISVSDILTHQQLFEWNGTFRSNSK